MSDTPESNPGSGEAGGASPGAHDWAEPGATPPRAGSQPAGPPTAAPTPSSGGPVPPGAYQGAWHQPPPQPGSWTPPPPAGAAPGDHVPGGPPWGAPGYPPPGAYPYWQQPAPPGGGWGGGGWGGPGSGGWYDWGSNNRPRRSLPTAVIALLLAVAVIVGLGIGHGVWTTAHNTSVSIPNGSNSDPFGNGSSGSSGSNGSSTSPFGNGFFGNGSSGDGNSSSTGGPGATLGGVAAKVANELVDIDTTLSYQGDEAAGTGIVLTSDGYVLTNNHVISGATSIKATDIGNGQTYTGTVVGYDRTHDIAVIKLQGASGLQTASFGDSSKLTTGQWVDGLGNAGGLGGTPSSASGQITALDQSITAEDESNGTDEKLSGLIQSDCDIQQGDSGGALIDASGQVVGMDTAASTGFSFQTQNDEGFSIPIDQARSIASQIRSGQASATVHIGETAFLGVEVDTSQQAATTKGAVISSTVPNGAAATAGITGGDVITSLGGTAITSTTDLTDTIERYHPGDKVPVVWTTANGQTEQATVTLGNGPAA